MPVSNTVDSNFFEDARKRPEKRYRIIDLFFRKVISSIISHVPCIPKTRCTAEEMAEITGGYSIAEIRSIKNDDF